MKKALKTFCQTQIKYFHTEVWKVSLECMEYKILSFQFEPVFAKRSCPGFSDGSDHDDLENQSDRLSSEKQATVQIVKRCQPVQNTFVATKFWKLRHFILKVKHDSLTKNIV